nr:MAG: protein m51 [Herpesviridae sp.]
MEECQNDDLIDHVSIQCGLEKVFDQLVAGGDEPVISFEPMLPRIYEITLPSLDARLNFISVGRRHVAFLRHVYGGCTGCVHAEIITEKMRLFSAILTKLLDVNGILERREVSDE